MLRIVWLWPSEKRNIPDSKVHGGNIGPIWVLSAPDGPHVGPMNLAITSDHNIDAKLPLQGLSRNISSRVCNNMRLSVRNPPELKSQKHLSIKIFFNLKICAWYYTFCPNCQSDSPTENYFWTSWFCENGVLDGFFANCVSIVKHHDVHARRMSPRLISASLASLRLIWGGECRAI